MLRYLITSTSILPETKNSKTDPKILGILTLSSTQANQKTLMNVALDWHKTKIEVKLSISEKAVRNLVRSLPLPLVNKVKKDYNVSSEANDVLIEIYKFQLAVFSIGIEIIKREGLIKPEIIEELNKARDISEVTPWINVILNQEGLSQLWWWEEQAENFIDLWFSPFRSLDDDYATNDVERSQTKSPKPQPREEKIKELTSQGVALRPNPDQLSKPLNPEALIGQLLDLKSKFETVLDLLHIRL